MNGDKAFVVDIEEGNQGSCPGNVEDLQNGLCAVVAFVNANIAGGEPWVSLLWFIMVSDRGLLLEKYFVVLVRQDVNKSYPSGNYHDVEAIVSEKLFTDIFSHTPNCR